LFDAYYSVKYNSSICACLLLLTVVASNDQEQLPHVTSTMSRETHSKLYDILFPLDVLRSSGNRFLIVLRYSPSFADNEQIVLVGKEGRVRVTETISNGNLWYKGNEILANIKRDDPVEIAKLIGVRKKEFDVPFPTVRAWRRHLLNGIGLALRPKNSETPADVRRRVETIILDGTVYEIWDQSESGDLHFELYWGEVTDRLYRGEPLFIRWMKIIRRDIRDFS
jgi:hypothetical protein